MSNIRALSNTVIVEEMLVGERKTKAGIILRSDDGKTEGIRPRWCRVYSLGEDIDPEELKVGQWVLVEHGRWTRKFTLEDDNDEKRTLWKVEFPEAVLLVSDERPEEDFTTKITA